MIDTAILMMGGGRFAMVGDSSFDVNAAKNAHVPVVALSFGYNDRPADELGADRVIDHYDELVGALEELWHLKHLFLEERPLPAPHILLSTFDWGQSAGQIRTCTQAILELSAINSTGVADY